MKKTGSKRGSNDSGLGAGVLDAPEESFALKGATVGAAGGWMGRGPAPIGSLQRGYGADEEPVEYGGHLGMEPEYVPRRGGFRLRMHGIPKSVAGRIVLGVVVFGAVSAVAITLGVARYYLMHDERFVMASSSDIEILGDDHLSRPQVLSVFAGDLERNIFRVPLSERKADLERLPWVAHATVMRLLPDKIRVKIMERTPVAFVRQGTQIGLVDGGGVLLDMPPEAAGDPQYSFPVLTGISAELPLSTRAARMDVYKQFIKELDGSGEKLTNSLSEVDVSNPEDVKALIASGSSDILVHFGDEAFLTRYREFQEHLPEWRQQYPKLASADMRYEGQIVLEMQGGASVPAGDSAATSTTLSAPIEPAPAAAVPVAPVAVHNAPMKAKMATTKIPLPVVQPEPAKVSLAAPVVAVPKPVAAKVSLGMVPKLASGSAKPIPSKPVMKAIAKPATKGKGAKSASNEKMFAALAAARKAQAKTGVSQ
jgi:cell division protein FtsQ